MGILLFFLLNGILVYFVGSMLRKKFLKWFGPKTEPGENNPPSAETHKMRHYVWSSVKLLLFLASLVGLCFGLLLEHWGWLPESSGIMVTLFCIYLCPFLFAIFYSGKKWGEKIF